MTQHTWLTDKQVGLRYNTSPKWVWYHQKRDPRFPRGVKFSNGMTRWLASALEAYDATVAQK